MTIENVDKVESIEDPAARAKAATELLSTRQADISRLARIRQRAIEELRATGLSYAQVGEAIGVTRGRIAQIRAAGHALELEFFGHEEITILTPLRSSDDGRPLVAQEDFAAATELAKFLNAADIETNLEQVSPEGFVDLDAEGLIAICGPKSSPMIERLIKEDPYIEYTSNDKGTWRIRDRESGTEFFSGSNEEPTRNRDAGYLARLRRPDTGWPMIVIAGVSAVGSLGVVNWFANIDNLRTLYRSVGDRPFSAVITSSFDPSPLQISSSAIAVGPYIHD
jgi:hypothetical protein